MLRAASLVNSPRLLASSAATGMSVTGTVNETALASITIPAGAMGANGGVEIRTVWTITGSTNAKTLRVRLGGAAGTQFLASVFSSASSVTFSDARRIKNRNSQSAQVGSASVGAVSVGTGTTALPTATENTANAVDVVISGQLASAGETITLESYEVWLLP